MRNADTDFYSCPVPFPTTTWRGQGIRAVDGDTHVLKVDLGWFHTGVVEIRLWDIDTWERLSGTPAERALGELARRYVDMVLRGSWVRLTTKMDPEKYGRILGHVDYWEPTSRKLVDLTKELDALGFRKGTPGQALRRISSAAFQRRLGKHPSEVHAELRRQEQMTEKALAGLRAQRTEGQR